MAVAHRFADLEARALQGAALETPVVAITRREPALKVVPPLLPDTRVHPVAVAVPVAAAACFLVVVWAVFGGGETSLVLAVITVFALMFFGLFVGRGAKARNVTPDRAHGRTFQAFLAGDVDTGRITGREALDQIAAVPVALADRSPPLPRSIFHIATLAFTLATASVACAAEPLHVYGPGGPVPAMKEAAAAFGQAHGIQVDVVAGPTPQWIDQAKANADLIFSGSEVMMSDFITALPSIDTQTVQPLYLRPAAILVRPGNPGHITGVADLLKPGHRILVVNGAGQQGLWEDVVGRLGDIRSVRAFRANVAVSAANSGQARQTWISDPTIDAWLIWTIWQRANPTLADQVPVEPQFAIYRDTGIALTKQGEARPEARAFAAFLASPQGSAIFAKWGWLPAK